MAGKPKPVDLKALRQLARIGATDVQIGHALGVSVDTLARRFRGEIDAARSDGAVWALQRAHDRAARGCWPAIECLLVHLCGWGKAHADQIINIVQNSNYGAPQPNAAELRQRYAEAQAFVDKHLAELEDGNGQGRLP